MSKDQQNKDVEDILGIIGFSGDPNTVPIFENLYTFFSTERKTLQTFLSKPQVDCIENISYVAAEKYRMSISYKKFSDQDKLTLAANYINLCNSFNEENLFAVMFQNDSNAVVLPFVTTHRKAEDISREIFKSIVGKEADNFMLTMVVKDQIPTKFLEVCNHVENVCKALNISLIECNKIVPGKRMKQPTSIETELRHFQIYLQQKNQIKKEKEEKAEQRKTAGKSR